MCEYDDRSAKMATEENGNKNHRTDLDLVHEGLGHEVLVLRNVPAVYADGEVLGHVPRFHRFDDRLLHVLREHLTSNDARS